MIFRIFRNEKMSGKPVKEEEKAEKIFPVTQCVSRD